MFEVIGLLGCFKIKIDCDFIMTKPLRSSKIAIMVIIVVTRPTE